MAIPDDTPFLEAVYDALASSQNLPSAEDQTEQAANSPWGSGW